MIVVPALTFIHKVIRRLIYTWRRHRDELQSVSGFLPEERWTFYSFYLLRAYLQLPIHLPFRPDPTNMLFRISDLVTFAKDLHRVWLFDARLRELLSEFSIKGVRAWEYGKLLSLTDLASHPDLLDVGPGSSTLPYFLAHQGARVTTIDLPDPMEEPWDFRGDRHHVKDVRGTVLKLPFKDASFDLVVAISTIEHLDTDYPEKTPVPYRTFLRRSERALSEMIRVLNKGGRLFITSDAYLPRQKTDRWKIDIPYRGIGGAYRFRDINSRLLQYVRRFGCQPIYPPRYSESPLRHDASRSNYRGRYLTTFALWCEKIS